MTISRVEDYIRRIVGYSVNLTTPKSRLEYILKSIIDGTEYTKPPLSSIEALFLRFKGQLSDARTALSRWEAILHCVIEGIPYDRITLTRVEFLTLELENPAPIEGWYLRSSDLYDLYDADSKRLLSQR